jgi:hypothetical protein
MTSPRSAPAEPIDLPEDIYLLIDSPESRARFRAALEGGLTGQRPVVPIVNGRAGSDAPGGAPSRRRRARHRLTLADLALIGVLLAAWAALLVGLSRGETAAAAEMVPRRDCRIAAQDAAAMKWPVPLGNPCLVQGRPS